jgi:methylenetetrahydrofolate reductase (NADPH)
MPITNFEQLASFSKICDADIHTWTLNRLEMYRDDIDSLKAFGLDVVSEMCVQTKARVVNDFHFYTINRSKPVLSIVGSII